MKKLLNAIVALVLSLPHTASAVPPKTNLSGNSPQSNQAQQLSANPYAAPNPYANPNPYAPTGNPFASQNIQTPQQEPIEAELVAPAAIDLLNQFVTAQLGAGAIAAPGGQSKLIVNPGGDQLSLFGSMRLDEVAGGAEGTLGDDVIVIGRGEPIKGEDGNYLRDEDGNLIVKAPSYLHEDLSVTQHLEGSDFSKAARDRYGKLGRAMAVIMRAPEGGIYVVFAVPLGSDYKPGPKENILLGMRLPTNQTYLGPNVAVPHVVHIPAGAKRTFKFANGQALTLAAGR